MSQNTLSLPSPFFFDGAMGTYFSAMPGHEMTSPETRLLVDPDEITRIHEEYLQAGAMGLKTCSFAATSLLESAQNRQAESILEKSVQAAEKAVENFRNHCRTKQNQINKNPENEVQVNEDPENECRENKNQINPEDQSKNKHNNRGNPAQLCDSSVVEDRNHKDGDSLDQNNPNNHCDRILSEPVIFGDIGPAATYETAAEVYIRQAQIFYDLGLRHLLVETLSSDAGLRELAEWARSQEEPVYLLCSFAIGTDGFSKSGYEGKDLLVRTSRLPGISAVGLNCHSGPHHLHTLLKELPALDVPVSIMPNAGYPLIVGRKVVYEGSPAYFGSQMGQIYAGGAAILGGCCGTTPEHIKAMIEAIQNHPLPVHPQTRKESSFIHERDTLFEKFEGGGKVVAVELDPPKNDRITGFLENVRTLDSAGASFITIADCPIGRPRADSSLLACKIKRELGVDVLPHMTCRDRNLNATKALLLGLSMEDIHSILLVTGDPLPSDLRDEVQSVFSFHSRGLARYISSLSADTISSPFHMFGALNLNAANFDVQLRLAKEKEANGMCGFLTQPVHSRKALDNLIKARQELKGRILGGIMPIVSKRNADFLANEIGGMDIAEEIVRLYEGKDRQESEDIAVKICLETARAMKDHVDGYYIMTPFQRVSLVCRLMEAMKQEKLLDEN